MAAVAGFDAGFNVLRQLPQLLQDLLQLLLHLLLLLQDLLQLLRHLPLLQDLRRQLGGSLLGAHCGQPVRDGTNVVLQAFHRLADVPQRLLHLLHLNVHGRNGKDKAKTW